jgi:hypothetical protein
MASSQGYHMWFLGEIVGINAKHGIILIARGPTETAGPAIVNCLLPHRALRHISEGMQVDAQADTRRTPWRILHLRVLHSFPKAGEWTS